MKKLLKSSQVVRSNTQRYFSPPLHSKSELLSGIHSNAGNSSSNSIPTDITLPGLLFVRSRSPGSSRALRKSASLPSIPEQTKLQAEQFSSAVDDSFYPSYLQHSPLVLTSISSNSVEEYDSGAMRSVPTSRSLARRLARSRTTRRDGPGRNATIPCEDSVLV
jgi:hypothetical protein